MSRLRLKQLAQDGATTGQAVVWNGTTWVATTPAAGYTDEQARDAIGAALVAGTGVTITVNDPADTITIAAAGGGYSRATATVTTASLANNATSQTTITLAIGYRLLKVQTDVAARVRIYTTAAKQAADLSRAAGTDPTGDSGLVLDYVTTASVLSADLSPQVDGSNLETTPTSAIALTVTNLSGSTSTVAVTLTYIRTE